MAILAQIDEPTSLLVSSLTVPSLVFLYESYHQDGMLEIEVIALIQIWAGFRDNYEFKKTFLPAVEKTLSEYHFSIKDMSQESQLKA